jgi:L-aspartate oxidase
VQNFDFLVIGSGLAGLSFALKAAEFGRVGLISKTTLETGNTEMAQGGIAAVTSREDSLESHIQDTLQAGDGLCDPQVVKYVVHQGPERVQDLVRWGVNFDLSANNDFALTKEGGHSHRRILHVEDHTGLDIQRQLLREVRRRSDIVLFENQLAFELILVGDSRKKVRGAYVLDRGSGAIKVFVAGRTVLATGGAGKAYLYTSNWSGATGDGIVMAHDAGAKVANLEFMQFHPTCLYHPQSRNFLISEALRGEGGRLINFDGRDFMTAHDPRGSLATRDIVARAIDSELKSSGKDCVYLDMTHLPGDFLLKRFPKIYETCMKLGIDMARDPIPVVPAAHYLCGGVVTDLNAQTNVENLFVIGESACTGLHGANRLASNSLLECLAFSHGAAEWMKKNPLPPEDPTFRSLRAEAAPPRSKASEDDAFLVSHMWDEVRRLMWAYVGIVRSNRRLERAARRLEGLAQELKDFPFSGPLLPDLIELRNITIFAQLTVACARARNESRGIHFNIDYR